MNDSRRVQTVNSQAVRASGKFVLYWMTSQRRTRWNFALEHAIEQANTLHKPLLVFEPLRAGYPWACARFHHFVIQGMRDNAAACDEAGVTYWPYLEPESGAGSGLLEALADEAALVVTDEFPCFFLPGLLRMASRTMSAQLQAVDGNGLVPLRATPHAFSRAFDFRRWLQKNVLNFVDDLPQPDPLRKYKGGRCEVPAKILKRWKSTDVAKLAAHPERLTEFPIDQQVKPSEYPGGPIAASQRLESFLRRAFDKYGEQRSHPDADAASGLSPYLHFGHLSTHEILARVWKQEQWNPGKVSKKVTGSNDGWWGLSSTAESFVDELLTWRELGYNCCHHMKNYDRYESLPAWCRKTLEEHAADPRPHLYELEDLAASRTADAVWNAAQTQLREEGRMHNYLRMLWGKRLLEWTDHPRTALAYMIELNNRYALDGRNPNSYSGIFWVLGRYDRPWAPERPIYGTIRYMSSENTLKKLKMKEYMRTYGGSSQKKFNY